MVPQSWLRDQRHHAGRYLSLAVGLGALGGFLLIYQAWLLARAVDAVVSGGAGLKDVMPWLWPMLAIFLLRAVVAWASEQTAFVAAARVKVQLRARLFRHIQALGPLHLAEERSGELVHTVTDGVEALEGYYARFLPAISLTALVPCSIIVFVFPMDWLSGLVMLVTAPLIPLFMVLIGKGAETLNQRQWQRLARMSAHFLDVIQGLTTLKVFNASRHEVQVIARISDEYRRSTMAVLRVAFLSSLVLEFFATVSIAVVAVLIGFRLMWGEMAFLGGFFVLLLAPEFYLPLRNMGSHYHARMEAVAAAERMVQILLTKPPVQPAAPLPIQRAAAPRIVLQDVHFAYEQGRTALAGASFEIGAGEHVALVGPSGAGKSTVVNALLGFLQPDSGHILVDGVSLAQGDLEQWRRCVAWLPQRPRLFAGTLLENIRLGRPEADMDAVVEAARLAHAHEFIAALADGYETHVGEAGQGLSGGQIQRVALARAFLEDASFIILDEATAHLDPATDALVREAIVRLATGRTVLVVAHRLSTARNADRIVLMHEGRVVEQGGHDALVTEGGLYARLAVAGVPVS